MQQNFDEDLICQKTPVADIKRRLNKYSPSPLPNYNITEMLVKENKSNKKTYKGRTLSIIENSAKYQKEKENKIKQMKKQEQSNQMKECTFKPNINKNQSKKRTLQQFLDFQNQFTNKVQTKREALGKQMKENYPMYSFKPKININKLAIHNIPTHQRLYNLSKQQAKTERSITQSDFIPAITSRGRQTIRNAPFHQHLYADALRRQKQQTQRDEHSLSPEPKQKNQMNQKLAAQKVIRQYYGHILNLNIQKLSFEQFVEIFTKMGFLSIKSEQEQIVQKQKRLLFQAYEQIQVPSIRNVCVFILALIGIYNINPINFTRSQCQQKVFEINYSIQSGRKLQRYFDIFFRNRLSMQSIKTINISEEPTFKPTINPKSQTLAIHHRSRMIQQTSIMLESASINLPKQGPILVTHADLLHLNKLGKQVQNMRKKELRQQQQMKDCTFNPNNRSRQINKPGLGDKKCYELYEKAKYIHRQNRSISDRQFQQNKQQCTFKPTIHKAPQRPQVEQKTVPDFNKTVARMFEGRRLKQQKDFKFLTQQNLTPRKTNPQMSKSNESSRAIRQSQTNKKYKNMSNEVKQQLPFLVIDVNLGDSVQQIVINKSDVTEGERLAKQFADKHSLDAGSRQKLIQLLGMQICNVLNQITQEDERDWSEDS